MIHCSSCCSHILGNPRLLQQGHQFLHPGHTLGRDTGGFGLGGRLVCLPQRRISGAGKPQVVADGWGRDAHQLGDP